MTNTIGDNISKFRKSKALTQEQLGAACGGRSVNQLNGYERGRSRPSPPILKIIADALDVSVNDLTGDVTKPVKEAIAEDFLRSFLEEAARRLGVSVNKIKVSIELAA